MQITKNQILGLATFVLFTSPQTSVEGQNYNGEIWGAYINSLSINDKWKIWHDLHYVPNAFAIIRPGITYEIGKGFQSTVGYAFVLAATPRSNKLIRQEQRIWGQLIKVHKIHYRWKYIIRFRYDARFRQSLDAYGELVENAQTFNNRLRLMQQIRYVASKNQHSDHWHIDLINEILLNTDKNVANGLDQVRSYLMIGYTHHKITFLAGYHQRFIPGKSVEQTLNQGFTLWIIHVINLSRSAKAVD